jgi:hypothetical protein
MTSKHYDVNGLNATVELGKGGPKVTNASGVIEARDQAGTAFAKVRADHPVGPNDVVTLKYLQTKGDVTVLGQITGGSPPAASVEGRMFICTTTGGLFTVNNLYYDTGLAWEEVVPSEGLSMVVTDALTGGTVEFTADHAYLWNLDGTEWVDIGPSAAASLAKIVKTREASLAFGTSSPLNIGTTIPQYGRVLRVCVNVTQAFNGTVPTVEIGDAGDTNRYMTVDENNLKATGVYWSDTFYMVASATQLIATYVADTSSAGACTVFVEWSEA